MTQSDRESEFMPDFSNLVSGLDDPLPNASDRSGFEPELGAELRYDSSDRTGFEPELGGFLRQKGVFVDEVTCIGCKHCALTARNTFYIEPDLGRARVANQTGDSEDIIQEAIDTCPVNCIHWVDYTELKQLEAERALTPVPRAGLPISRGRMGAETRRRQPGS
jgi:ferredoxin